MSTFLTFQSSSQTDSDAMHGAHTVPERFAVGPFDHIDLDWGTITVVRDTDGDQITIATTTHAVANIDGVPDLTGWRFTENRADLRAAGLSPDVAGLTFTRCYIGNRGM